MEKTFHTSTFLVVKTIPSSPYQSSIRSFHSTKKKTLLRPTVGIQNSTMRLKLTIHGDRASISNTFDYNTTTIELGRIVSLYLKNTQTATEVVLFHD